MFSKRNHLLYHFTITIHLHLATFYAQNTFKKIGKMPIEQTTEFQLKGPGPFGRTCTPITGKLHDETKISKKNLREDYGLLLKYCRGQCALLSPIDQITYN